MSPMARTARRVVLDLTVAVAILLFAFLAVGPRLLPYQTVTMLTGSMRPSVPPGSVAVDVAEPVGALRPGQVISFHAPTADHPVVTHRVVAVVRRNGMTLVRTRGDANPGEDPWTAQVHGDTVWRVRAVVPHLGTMLRLLRRPQVHVVVAWVVPAALLAWLLSAVWRERKGDERGCESSGRSRARSSPRHA